MVSSLPFLFWWLCEYLCCIYHHKQHSFYGHTIVVQFFNRPFATLPIIQFWASFWGWRECWSSSDAGKATWFIMAMHMFQACVHHTDHWVPNPCTCGFSWLRTLILGGNGIHSWYKMILAHQTPGHLTHWGRAMHICVNKLTTIGPDNGLSPGRRQAIIWTIAGILLIGPLGTNFSEILIGIQTFSFKKMRLKMSSAKWRPFLSASMC